MSPRLYLWILVAGATSFGEGSARQSKLVMTNRYASVPHMIAAEGYPVEKHRVTTHDGYVLQMHRIPAGRRTARRSDSSKGKKAVLIVHGLAGSSSDWVLMGPKRSLAYMLADAGYDVWLGNMRGTECSSHVKMPKTDPKFWDFSFQEHGKYDVTAFVDKVLETTGLPKLLYVGYSMGTTSFFIMMDQKPEYNNKVMAFIGLAPAIYMDNVKTTAHFIEDIARWPDIMHSQGQNAVTPTRSVRDMLADNVCAIRNSGNVCLQVLYSFVGEDIEQNDWELMPIAIARSQPISIRQIEHFLKNAMHGDFLPWGGGMQDVSTPPYNLSRTEVPAFLYYGLNDLLTSKDQVMRLARALNVPSEGREARAVHWPKFNHVDFVFAKDLGKILNQELVSKVNEIHAKYDDHARLNHTAKDNNLIRNKRIRV